MLFRSKVLGPVPSTFGGTAVLFERDTVPAYARVVAAAAKVPEAQVVPTVTDPRFPAGQVVLFADTAPVQPAPLAQPLPVSAVQASVVEWRPGEMRIALTGQDPREAYLVVSENWYPDWHAQVDGKPGQVVRADHSLIGVVLPQGAREVQLRFTSAAYARGKVVSLAALMAALVLCAAPVLSQRRAAGA